MGRSILPLTVWVALCGCGASLSAAPPSPLPAGPSFRLETEIYQDQANEPVSRHKILFDSGVIYDLQEHGGHVQTVFDPARQRVILLDTKAQVQAEVSTQHLIDVTAQLSVAARQQGKTETFGLDAVVSSDNDQYWIAFGSCQYQTTTQTVSRPELATAYHELTVWAARLNVLRRLGAPPFARMTLGEKLAADGRLPLDLTLTIDQGVSKQHYRAHHLVLEKLSELDRRAIETVGDQLASFRKVAIDDFPSEP